MPDAPDLPAPAPGGLCIDCQRALRFVAGDGERPAHFVCKRCGRRYRGADEWKVKPGTK